MSSPSSRARRFAPVQLSEARLDAFHSSAHTALSHTIKEFTKLDGRKHVDAHRWAYIRTRGDLSVYSDKRPFSEQLTSLLVAGTMNARLADVMEGLYADTSEHTRIVQHMVSPRFLDADVLQVVEQRSIEQPYAFTGLKWSLVKASSGGIVANRDLCYLEKLGMICIGGGRKLGYFIMQSVDLPECPPPNSSKVVRAHVSLCYLFEELADNVVGVYMIGTMECHGPKFMAKIVRNTFADIALAFGNTVDIARAKRFTRMARNKSRESHLPQQATTSSSSSTRAINCDVCHSIPSLFDHTQECAGCNRTNVCKKCRTKCDLLQREHESTKRLVAAVFCRHCVARGYSSSSDKPSKSSSLDALFSSTATTISITPSLASTKPRTSSDDVLGSSFATVSEDDGETEQQPASQRSLRRFSMKLLQQLEDVGYASSSASERLTGLSTLGSGRNIVIDDLTDDVSDNSCAIMSPAASGDSSSGFSVADLDDDDDDVASTDDDDVISIRPVRRSLQPPELLEAPHTKYRGRRGPHGGRSHTMDAADHNALLSRLVQVSLAAEHTFQITKAQSRLAQSVFERSRVKT